MIVATIAVPAGSLYHYNDLLEYLYDIFWASLYCGISC
jgi:hypothetical protein